MPYKFITLFLLFGLLSINAANAVATTNSSASGVGFDTLPSGTTAQRPPPAEGKIRDNTTLGAVEVYISGAWKTLQAGVVNMLNGGTGLSVNSTTATNLGLLTYSNIIGHYSMLDCDSNWPNEAETAAGTSLQNCLLKTQRMAILAGAARQSNLGLAPCIEFDVIGASPNLSTSIVVPRYVCYNPRNTPIRDGSSGTAASNWTGDTTTKSLANLYEPNFIFPPTGIQHGSMINHLNSNGSDGGSGPFYGKTWRVMTMTIASGGTGFVGGETCTMANGDPTSPSAGATFTVATASGGAAATLTYAPSRWATQTGQYYLPPFQQAQQWTSVNGWDGHDSFHPVVFDGSGNYRAACSGAGASLTITPTWWPDWCDGTNGCTASTIYDGDFANFSPSTGYLEHIVAVQSRQSTSALYGKTRAFAVDAYDIEIGRIQTGGASIGFQLNGSDARVDWVNDVGSAIQFKMRGGGSLHVANAVWDTPVDSVASDAHAADIDNCQGCSVASFTAFHNANSGATMGNQQVRLGSDLTVSDATHQNTNLILNGQFYSDAVTPSGTLAAFYCAYTVDGKLNGTVSNLNSSGTARASQYNILGQNSATCGSSVVLTGTLNNQPTNDIFNGTNGGWMAYDPQKAWYAWPSIVKFASRTAPVFAFTNTSSSDINYIQVSGGLTTVNPLITALSKSGGDTNVALGMTSTGSGNINFYTEASAVRQAAVKDVASAVNYLTFSGSATGLAPTLGVAGTDGTIGLNLAPSSGNVNIATGLLTFGGVQIAASNLSNGTTGTGAVTLAASPTHTGTVTGVSSTWSGAVAIGTTTQTAGTALDMGSTTGAVLMPVGTTGQEPTGAVGMIRYNSTTNSFEGYSGASPAWGAIGGSGSSQWTTSGSNIYFATGNVSIGTTANSQPLQVVGRTQTDQFALSGTAFSGATWTTSSSIFNIPAIAVADTTGSGAVTTKGIYTINAPTMTSTSSQTITNLATLYIDIPVASTNVTASNKFGLFVNGSASLGQLTANNVNVNNSGVAANGIYRPATNTLGFSTNSTAIMALGTAGLSLGTSYVSTAAPTNGAIIQGNVAIGSSATPRNSSALDVTGIINAGGVIIRNAYTVSTLPSTAGAGKVTGAMAYVTDAVACTFLATLTGGGSTYCPVGYNGTAWVGE